LSDKVTKTYPNCIKLRHKKRAEQYQLTEIFLRDIEWTFYWQIILQQAVTAFAENVTNPFFGLQNFFKYA